MVNLPAFESFYLGPGKVNKFYGGEFEFSKM